MSVGEHGSGWSGRHGEGEKVRNRDSGSEIVVVVDEEGVNDVVVFFSHDVLFLLLSSSYCPSGRSITRPTIWSRSAVWLQSRRLPLTQETLHAYGVFGQSAVVRTREQQSADRQRQRVERSVRHVGADARVVGIRVGSEDEGDTPTGQQ